MQSEELREYTVRLQAAEKSGTGFFVAPGLILTCAHVVTDNNGNAIASVKVYWKDCNYTAVVDKLPDNPNVDLALLKLDKPIPEHSCVFLDETLANGDCLYSFGYADQYPQGEPRDFIYTDLTGDDPPLMTFRDEQVQPGFSGAPLFNRRTSKICGVIKRSRDIHTSLGGRGISVSIIFEHFPQLKPTIITYLPNPFNYRTGRIDDPQLVFGREKEVNRIFDNLNDGSSVAIIGEAEIGKSSLLRLVEHQATNKLNSPRQPIYLNLGNVSDEEDFYGALCDLIDIPLCKGYQLSRQLKKYKLLFILDNVEKMAWSEFTNQIRSQIRALAEGSHAPLRLVIAANKPLNRLFSDSSMVSPFENICLEINVIGWGETTIHDFINYCLQNNPIRFTSKEITKIIVESKGHPKRVMELCYQTYTRYLK
ncbi:MAG: trypsin-like peptidase domain-containing protein [Waterburya sp.]